MSRTTTQSCASRGVELVRVFVWFAIIPINADIAVWGKSVKSVEALVKNECEADENFRKEKLIPHIKSAVEILGENNFKVTEEAKKGTEEPKLKVRSLLRLVINFSGDEVCCDYYFDVGKIFGGFVVHIKGTPHGRLEYIGVS